LLYVLTELTVEYKRAGLILVILVSSSAWATSVIEYQCSLEDYPKNRTSVAKQKTFFQGGNWWNFIFPYRK